MPQELSLFSLVGKTILVGGASRGIGLAIANGLVSAGAQVVGFSRSATPPTAVFRYVSCDISDEAAVDKTIVETATEFGGIDAYFHVAGISSPAATSIQNTSTFRQTLDVNLTSAYHCCIGVAGHMIPRQVGSIVVVTSIGSLQGFPGNPGYVASKGGLRMMSKALALDLGKHNIRVNSLAPGYIHTDMTEASYHDAEKSKQRADRTMLERWGKPEELVGAAIFLASDASSYVTGSDLIVDGGWTAKGL